MPSEVPPTSSKKLWKAQSGKIFDNSAPVVQSSHGTAIKLFVCLYGPPKSKVYCRQLHDCMTYPKDEIKSLFKARADYLTMDGPSESTRGRKLLPNMALQFYISHITRLSAVLSAGPVRLSPKIGRDCLHLQRNCLMVPCLWPKGDVPTMVAMSQLFCPSWPRLPSLKAF